MTRFVALMAGALALLAVTGPALSVEPDEILKDQALEQRARAISKRLRCLVCQNQSIDDSNAGLARDLRVLVRQRLTKGESNEAVIAFIVARYGDFVLLRPPIKPVTYILWFGPALILLLAGFGAAAFLRRRRVAVAVPLTDDERKRVKSILGQGGE
ncbi:MAG: cytochrome c-type biogenesis protein CcmH [Alphaproteobacteria bacterium]|nr:cytochrome c-type biogenesis protein CcmH [Alphaproteobacteria bacterium]